MKNELYTYKAKVLKCVDGDTVDVLIDLGFNTFLKQRIRLAGINTPESRTKREEEKILGLTAKYLLEQYLGEDVVIKTRKKGKYGRYLGIVYPSGKTLSANEFLILNGLALPYFGGKRAAFLYD